MIVLQTRQEFVTRHGALAWLAPALALVAVASGCVEGVVSGRVTTSGGGGPRDVMTVAQVKRDLMPGHRAFPVKDNVNEKYQI